MYCYKHPKVETNLSCGKCERPICTNCMMVGPAGVRCRECASLRGTHLYQIAPARLALCVIVALVLGVAGSVALEYSSFFALIVAVIYGGIMAQAMNWASGRKQGPILIAIAVAGIVGGALLLLAAPLSMGIPLYSMGIGLIWKLVGIGVAISTCVGRMRYL